MGEAAFLLAAGALTLGGAGDTLSEVALYMGELMD